MSAPPRFERLNPLPGAEYERARSGMPVPIFINESIGDRLVPDIERVLRSERRQRYHAKSKRELNNKSNGKKESI